MTDSLSPIGIFDSGVGGLSILRDIASLLPQYDYLYLADSLHVPYGGRSDGEILSYTKRAVDFFIQNNTPLVILACNTATAVALRTIQQQYLATLNSPIRVLGVIRPILEALKEKGIKKPGMLATKATVRSDSFIKEMANIGYHPEVIQVACPSLVPLIEQGIMDSDHIHKAVSQYTAPLIAQEVDAVVLGCTHYNHIFHQIQASLPASTKVYSEGPITAERLADYLARHPEIESSLTRSGSRTYYATQINPEYPRLFSQFVGYQVPNIKIATL